jgi:hypothetical protein
LLVLTPLWAQSKKDPLTEQQIEEVREAGDDPPVRIKLYVGYLEERITDIHKLNADHIAQNKTVRLHNLFDEFTRLSDELQDNMDAFDQQHADLRKMLKEIVEKTAQWTTVMNEPVPNTGYDFARKSALDSNQTAHDTAELHSLFAEEYRALRPRAPLPGLEIRFRRFTSLNTTIRLREGRLHVHLSDLLEGAPESVLRAILHILLAKLYRKPLNALQTTRYRRFASSEAVIRQTELIRQSRGRKKMLGPQGQHYNLDEIFESLNSRFFHGLMGRPLLTWSGHMAKRSLGHYDPAHNTIVVSRVFDRKNTPRYAVEYLLYHEMLHLKHPVKVRGGRRCVHPREFQLEERLFPDWQKAKEYLKTI